MNLKQLSEILGLSQTTVSRALNGYPEVNEATRERVQAAATKHGYRPNSRAKGLATGRSMVIGHVIPSSSQHEMVNPIFGDFVAGAARTYGAHGYDMMFTNADDTSIERTYRDLFQRGAVDGVVLQGPKVNEHRVEVLTRMAVPFIVHGRSTGIEVPYDWVDVNNKRSFLRATRFLIDLGHKRIALINGLEDMDFAQRRREGYLQALQEADLTPEPALMRSAEMTEVYGHHEARDMLQLDNPPTAILVSSMISAIGVRRALNEAGLKMGRDVSVIAHDDDLSYLKNGQDVPIFTATRSSVRQAGEIAAEMLIDRIKSPDDPVKTRLLEAELVVGGSTGPAPDRF
ncbi:MULTISPECIES: substrate-binding domain-containing protein [unclassified Ruegeria]|uniref:LacI family DNA-binding transcriptional regulator n=1 Tax=unclassified Ruegeria TaxID=2625375 RepID=UPI001ADC4B43|nr:MULTISPECIES: substrate-binding domain-containing protein [unclassified Ruegeria]MBO9412514.1 substrate-binding domain-containing protein [Ruegeria sp. R8_1]MBO9416248.1 substrate-binding domain-containing protein [Ruegeria sp. R8_2]